MYKRQVDEEGLGLLDRIAGDLLEQLHLGLLELIDLVLLGVDRGDLLVERCLLYTSIPAARRSSARATAGSTAAASTLSPTPCPTTASSSFSLCAMCRV